MAVYILIIPAALKPAADAVAAKLASVNFGETFTVRLHPHGFPDVASHWAAMPNIVPPAAQAALRSIVANDPFRTSTTIHECLTDDLRSEFLALIAGLGLEESENYE